MGPYQHPVMQQFALEQTRFAKRPRRLEQLVRAERLFAEIDARRDYPYQYICFRITDFRPDNHPDLVLPGKALREDLRRLVEDLSDSLDLEAGQAGEAVLTVEQVAEKFSVSSKTVNRWRRKGLLNRRYVIDGRKRVGFLGSAVDAFAAANAERIERGSQFSQLSDEEREEVIHRARRLSRVFGATLAEVSRRVSRRLGRSPETVRYTIKNFDRQHPKRALFPTMRGPLGHEDKKAIYRAHRRGIAIEALARRHSRTRSTIYRVINEMRHERFAAKPTDYMHHPSFDEPNAREAILCDEPLPETKPRQPRPPAGLPQYLRALYETPLLTKEQEQHLFRKMNFLLHLARTKRAGLDVHHLKASDLDELERWQDEAEAIKRRLIRCNLRLVVNIAKRHVGPTTSLFELISDGNVSLMRAVEKFDFGRNFKFSTYASWAIMKNFARSIPTEHKRRDRFSTGHELVFDAAADHRADQFQAEAAQQRMQAAVDQILKKLDDRERRILISRYGLSGRGESQTLEQVGSRLGVTKERVRQIEARAIGKLREFARERELDLSAFVG